ncbi:MAG: hypothetical protein R3F44_02280 [Candidatus Competibacteraceae bacterium]
MTQKTGGNGGLVRTGLTGRGGGEEELQPAKQQRRQNGQQGHGNLGTAAHGQQHQKTGDPSRRQQARQAGNRTRAAQLADQQIQADQDSRDQQHPNQHRSAQSWRVSCRARPP